MYLVLKKNFVQFKTGPPARPGLASAAPGLPSRLDIRAWLGAWGDTRASPICSCGRGRGQVSGMPFTEHRWFE